ncbi:MAG TPA: exodeoxyribonuclease VII small subunit [Anaerolineales bacterium]|nr:exodeoxyribonuclease VII small subunit [Anaerolineales bacterium]
MSTPSNLPPVENLTYEQALAELEDLVAALEAEHQTLTEALALYARGQALAQHCAALLDQAELKVQQLTTAGLSDFTPQA